MTVSFSLVSCTLRSRQTTFPRKTAWLVNCLLNELIGTRSGVASPADASGVAGMMTFLSGSIEDGPIRKPNVQPAETIP